ncbi:MAG: sigma-70 family RNA polymerase sigma factor [Myxococcales bacterium]|nr:sigma-70 family RNA polymerase sigma factor [Myxococcales bacterium]
MGRRWTPDEIERAVGGDSGLLNELFNDLLAPIHATTARTLRQSWKASRLPVRVDLLEALDEVMVHLLEQDGRALRRWDPARGRLDSYVTAIVRNRVKTHVDREYRGAREHAREREREREDEASVFDRAAPHAEEELIRGVEIASLLKRLEDKLSPENFAIARMRFLEGNSAAEIGRTFGLAEEAVRTRIRRIRILARDLQ